MTFDLRKLISVTNSGPNSFTAMVLPVWTPALLSHEDHMIKWY